MMKSNQDDLNKQFLLVEFFDECIIDYGNLKPAAELGFSLEGAYAGMPRKLTTPSPTFLIPFQSPTPCGRRISYEDHAPKLPYAQHTPLSSTTYLFRKQITITISPITSRKPSQCNLNNIKGNWFLQWEVGASVKLFPSNSILGRQFYHYTKSHFEQLILEVEKSIVHE